MLQVWPKTTTKTPIQNKQTNKQKNRAYLAKEQNTATITEEKQSIGSLAKGGSPAQCLTLDKYLSPK